MALPRNVRAAARAAERIHAEAYPQPGGESAPQGDPPAPESAPAPAPVNEPEVQNPPVQEPPPAAEKTPEEIIKELEAKLAQESQRYNVLQGKYNAELPRERERAQMLENLLATVSKPAPAAPAPVTSETPPELNPASFLRPEDHENFGPEFIDFAQRAARDVVAAELSKIKPQIEAAQQGGQNAAQQAEMVAKQITLSKLAELVPDWERLNTDPGFLAWLETNDVYAGTPRKTLLRDAFAKNDVVRTAAFFNAYLHEQTTTGAAPPAAPSAPAPADTPKQPLANFAAPGTGKPSTAPAAPDKRVWTSADISRFYAEIRQGRFKGREAERKRIEADIFAAQREGRFRPQPL